MFISRKRNPAQATYVLEEGGREISLNEKHCQDRFLGYVPIKKTIGTPLEMTQ